MGRISLPIDAYLDQVGRIVGGEKRDLILMASTGSGKTTRVPPTVTAALLHGKVYVLEPRRLAARLSAERVAEESGWNIGQEVGYQFRFERRRTDRTPLTFLTEGTFTRELLSNPTLKGVSAVILDEFHERHLQGDLALALLRRLQQTSRPDLRIIVMSATLEKEALQRFLPGAALLEVEAPRFPIDIEYAPSEKDLAFQVRAAVKDLLNRPDSDRYGDLLVFLPGMAEIRRAESALSEIREIRVLVLHGELSKEEQELAFHPHPKTKVILATNIAESSLTIPGVNTVIDAGYSRVSSFSYWTGLPSLTTKSISRASAIQRAGRAGRTGPGRVVRLYSKGDFEGRAYADTPEIQRVDLMAPALELHQIVGKEAADFPFFEAPEARKWTAAIEALQQINALREGELTRTGDALVRLPLHPRLGRVLIEASRRDVLSRALTLVSALSEGAELGTDALEGLRQASSDPAVKRMVSRLEPIVRDVLSRPEKRSFPQIDPHGVQPPGNSTSSADPASPSGPGSDEELAASTLAGFPDRVGLKRGQELVLAAGGSVPYPQHPVFRSHEFFLVLDVRETRRLGETQSKLGLRSVLPLEELQLFDLDPPQLLEEKRWDWNDSKKRWECLELLSYQKLRLSAKIKESEIIQNSGRHVELLRKVYEEWRQELMSGDPKVRAILVRDEIRLGLVGEPDPAEKLFEYFLEAFSGASGVRDLPDWAGFWSCIGPAERDRLEKLVPVTVALAGRKSVPILYEPGQTPYVESRIQDFFGMRAGPGYLGGKKRFALHLLAPNGRAVQITEDLEGFWKNHYPSIRKELMRRYPRHKWPEDPLVGEKSQAK